jgi:hypothetical protein
VLSGTLTTGRTPDMINPGLFLVGAPLIRPGGRIMLVGSSIASGGPANGTAVDMIIAGTLSQPLP